ncbi:MAG: hypothetical protein QXG03_01285 [Halalkalicoccus sp.]
MNRDSVLYEIAHFAAVVGIAYLALLAARAAGVTALWAELLIALVVGVSYVSLVLYLDLAPPSWRGE